MKEAKSTLSFSISETENLELTELLTPDKDYGDLITRELNLSRVGVYGELEIENVVNIKYCLDSRKSIFKEND